MMVYRLNNVSKTSGGWTPQTVGRLTWNVPHATDATVSNI